MRRWFGGLIVVGMWASVAGAQPREESGHHHAPFNIPDLVNPAGAGADFVVARYGDPETITALTLEPYFVARVTPEIAVWGTFPLVTAFGNDENISGWGNLTGGGYFVRRRGDGWYGVGGSLSLPTAADDGDESIAAIVGGLVNIDDIGRYFPDVTTIRVHGDARGEADNLFVQSQVRIERLMSDANDGTLLFIGLAAGAQVTDSGAVVLELDIVSDALDDEAPSEDMISIGFRTTHDRGTLAVRLGYTDVFNEAIYMLGIDSRIQL